MRGKADRAGMETHISLMLLVTASILISAVSISLGKPKARDDDLFELRVLQSRCLAYCISSYETEAGRGPFIEALSDDDLPLCIVFDGSAITVIEGGQGGAAGVLSGLISIAPDGLGCLVHLGLEGDEAPEVGGDAVVHRSELGHGRSLVVALPLVKGGATCRGLSI